VDGTLDIKLQYRLNQEIILSFVKQYQGFGLDGTLILRLKRRMDGTLGKDKGSPYSITECRVPELIPVLGSHPTGDVSHKPGGRLPLLSARPAVTPTSLKRAATSFAAW